MKESLQDKTVDILKDRISASKQILKERYKNTKPFRKEPLDPLEQLHDYQQFLNSGMEQEMRESVGDIVVDKYKLQMDKIARRYKHA